MPLVRPTRENNSHVRVSYARIGREALRRTALSHASLPLPSLHHASAATFIPHCSFVPLLPLSLFRYALSHTLVLTKLYRRRLLSSVHVRRLTPRYRRRFLPSALFPVRARMTYVLAFFLLFPPLGCLTFTCLCRCDSLLGLIFHLHAKPR